MRPNKRLGQHFLRDPHTLREIAAIADVGRSAGALEIGPGEGALTAFLLQSGTPVVALEKDDRAIGHLRERFGDALDVVHGDALTADLAALLPPPRGGRLPVVVGNLPFNVGSAIYRRLLTLSGRVSRLVLMLQREVAQRIVAQAGSRSYGIPSVITALTAKSAWNVLDVPPHAFFPPPKVQSAVVLVELHDVAPLDEATLAGVDRFVSKLFQSRRKQLHHALDDAIDVEGLGLTSGVRVEQVPPETLLELYRRSLDAP